MEGTNRQSEAARLSETLLDQDRKVDSEVLNAVLAELGFGVALLDLQGKLFNCNQSACDILGIADANNPGSVSPFDNLSDVDAPFWQYALRTANLGERSMLRLSFANGPITVTVSPCQRIGNQVIVVMFERDALANDRSIEFLADEYHLTPAERRVVSGLMRGDVPKQLARNQGIAVSTIRTQIKHALSKMGASGIGDMILKVARFPMLPGSTDRDK